MSSINWYEKNANFYTEGCGKRTWPNYYQPFSDYLAPDAHILDAGCGPGKDTKMFLDQDFAVTAFDATKEFIKIAEDLTGHKILHLTFDEMNFNDEFDGIWSNASLLHVPREKMAKIFAKMIAALKTNGVWHMSFKYGETTREKEGRFFTDYTTEMLKKLIKEFPKLKILYLDKVEDIRPNRQGEFWTRAVVQKI